MNSKVVDFYDFQARALGFDSMQDLTDEFDAAMDRIVSAELEQQTVEIEVPCG